MATKTSAPNFTVTGKSGIRYKFYIFPIDTTFQSAGGVYLFTRRANDQITHHPVYLGITGNLANRFDNHHKAACITASGATHICAFIMSDEKARIAAEKDLLAVLDTTCNEALC